MKTKTRKVQADRPVMETNKAYAFKDRATGQLAWFPKSHTTLVQEGGEHFITLPAWLHRKKEVRRMNLCPTDMEERFQEPDAPLIHRTQKTRHAQRWSLNRHAAD